MLHHCRHMKAIQTPNNTNTEPRVGGDVSGHAECTNTKLIVDNGVGMAHDGKLEGTKESIDSLLCKKTSTIIFGKGKDREVHHKKDVNSAAKMEEKRKDERDENNKVISRSDKVCDVDMGQLVEVQVHVAHL